MSVFLFYVLVLSVFRNTKCDVALQINKKIEDVIYPVNCKVEEKVGTPFSLVCELVSTANKTNEFDDQLTWVKVDKNSPNQLKFTSDASNWKNDLIKEMNKSEKKFKPLRVDDRGNYSCFSSKFNIHKSVEIIVRDDLRRKEPRPMRETIICNKHMFHCVLDGVCIFQHFVCDGKADCKDGSDESVDTCNGDPCKDKIPCEDGRCIPTAWCCDRHHDPNCNITFRHTCCQYLSDSYEEMELGFPDAPQTQHTGARYLFISVCIISILFSVVLLLLIVSKVVIFAKKTALHRHNICENITLRNQTNLNIIPCDIYAYRHSRTRRPNIVRNIIIDSSDVNDPLLFNPARFNVINASTLFDQPPSYVDVLRTNRLVSEPPPPYRSVEMLDERENAPESD